ncbi:MAG: NfeD family protein [Candidatus Cloacimonadota bacterium]|nr:NfeD family protein [Candidatus Cloacimonadota bacterium]
MTIEPWMIWIAVGVLCMIIEIFTPTFLFLSFGVGAIFTGILSIFIPNPVLQIIIFCIATFLLFLRLRKFSNKLQSKNYKETNIYGLKNRKATVVIPIKKGSKGYVKIGGEEWAAQSVDNKYIKQGSLVRIVSIEGNTLFVKKEEEE